MRNRSIKIAAALVVVVFQAVLFLRASSAAGPQPSAPSTLYNTTLAPAACAAAPESRQAADSESKKGKKRSYFTELWQLDKETRAGKPWITFHRTNYALAFSYNSSPNPAPLQEIDPAKTLTKPEVTFQLSFKAKLWQDVFGKDMDLWFGYTQRSFWQLYNVKDSAPFRETNYEPELLLNFRTRFSLLGLEARFIQLGLNHQSNGQSEPLSRSWNRIVANVGLERGDFSLLLKGWFHFPESEADDDNPGINSYMGYGEVWAYYFLKKHRLGVMLRDNLDFGENRGAIQLEWSFPLFAQIGGYVQYYFGYGESLLDYSHRVNRIGVGFIFLDWD
jgi:phospholipase A1